MGRFPCSASRGHGQPWGSSGDTREDGKEQGWLSGTPHPVGLGMNPSFTSSGFRAEPVSTWLWLVKQEAPRDSLWGTGGRGAGQGGMQQAGLSLQGPSLTALGLGGPDSTPDPSLTALWTTPHRGHSAHLQMPTLHCKHCTPLQAPPCSRPDYPHPTATPAKWPPQVQPQPPHWTPPFPFKLEATFSDREAERRMGKVGWQSPFAR